MIKRIVIAVLLSFLLLSCATTSKSESNYGKELDKYSENTYLYKDLFDGKITVEAVFVSQKIIEALKKDIEQKNLIKENIPFPLQSEYPVFLAAFYHYDSKLNVLERRNSIWNVTLVINGKKYVPSSVKRLSRSNYKIFKFYFKNNQRFSRFYLIEFKELKSNELGENFKLIFSSMENSLELNWRL